MKFEIYLLLALLIFGIFQTRRSVRRSGSAEERFFAIRAAAFTWLVSFAVLTTFLFLPGKMRILFLIPVFLVGVSMAKFWRNGRARLQQARHDRVDFERMKRVN